MNVKQLLKYSLLIAILTGISTSIFAQYDISGTIYRENGQSVAGVTVSLNGTVSAQTVTNAAGTYTFTNLPAGGNYTITPEKSGNVKEGISVADQLKILRHILAIEPMTDYAIIRGDVNSSNGVSTIDLVINMNMILGNITAFPLNANWEFLPADFMFSAPGDPFMDAPFPSLAFVNGLASNEIQDFVALKIGDALEEQAPMGSPFMALEVPAVTAAACTTINVPVTATGFDNVMGLQSSLSWDPTVLQFNGVQNFNLQGLNAFNFGTSNANSGQISFCWFNPIVLGVSLANGTTIFNLSFLVIGQPGSSSTLAFAQYPTPFQVVDDNMNIFNLSTSDGSVTVTGAGGAVYFPDGDGDGYGDANSQQFSCTPLPGYVADGTDCDDGNASVNPGAAEVCGDGIDNNCDGLTDLYSSSTTQTIIDFFNAGVANGTITAANGGGNLTAFLNKLKQAQSAGNITLAINRLEWCMERSDDHTFLPNQPPNNNADDFLEGPGVPALNALIQEVIDNIECAGIVLQLGVPQGTAGMETNGDQMQLFGKSVFELYPNPATYTLNLDLHNFLEQEISIAIFNHLGQQVLDLSGQEMNTPVVSIDLSEHQLPNGIYMVSVRLAERWQARQFMIAR